MKPFLETRPEQVDLFLKCIRMGMSEKKSAEYAGLNPDTTREWKREGERRSEEGMGEEDAFVAFIARIKKARAEFVADSLAKIHRAAGKQWQASAWLLERRCPEDFSPRVDATVSDARIQIVSDVKKEGE